MDTTTVGSVLSLIILLMVTVTPVAAGNNSAPAGIVSPASILSYGKLFPVHAILMTLGFLLFVAAASFPVFRKGKPGWLGLHQILASAGTLISITAFAIAYMMVGSSGGPHVRVPHAFLGILAIVLILATFLLGFFRTRLKPYTIQAIAAHRWMGRLLLLLMAFAVVSGLFTAGLLN